MCPQKQKIYINNYKTAAKCLGVRAKPTATFYKINLLKYYASNVFMTKFITYSISGQSSYFKLPKNNIKPKLFRCF